MAEIGDRVKVRPSHWCRSNQHGTVVDPLNEGMGLKASDRYCIKFDRPGRGILGQYLYLDNNDFEVVKGATNTEV